MLKFNKLHVSILCICIGQICLGSDEFIDDRMKNLTKERIREDIDGVSEQFVDDFMALYEAYRDNFVHIKGLLTLLKWLSKTIPKDETSKIDVTKLKNWNYTVMYGYEYAIDLEQYVRDEAKYFCDMMKISQTAFSRKLPSKRYNGVVNLYYIVYNPNATTEEIDIAMSYLYSNNDAARKISFFDKMSELTARDCPHLIRIYSEIMGNLRTMIDIKPEVFQSFNTIREKFPCTMVALYQARRVLDLLTVFRGDKSKISACEIKEHPNFSTKEFSAEYLEHVLQMTEIVLSARLSDQVYRGILNFQRATLPNTPINEIEKSLEYLYDEVPQSNCIIAERSAD